MKKKVFALFLALMTTMFIFTSCEGEDPSGKDDPQKENPDEPEEPGEDPAETYVVRLKTCYKEYMAARLPEINAALSETSCDRFVFFTDYHAPCTVNFGTDQLIASILQNVPVRKVFFGGDAVMTTANCKTEDNVRKSLGMMDKCANVTHTMGRDFYPARGNHEITTGTTDEAQAGFTMSQSETYETLLGWLGNSPCTLKGDSSMNFYVDNKDAKLRYVVLDYYDGPKTSVYEKYKIGWGYKSSAESWLKSSLNNLKAGWKAVVILHDPINKTTGYSESWSSFASFLKTINDAGNVVLVLTGHDHKDSEAFENGVLHVSTTSCLNSQAKPDVFKGDNRDTNTSNENAIDIVDLDLNNNMIKMFRVGGGFSRYYNLLPVELKTGETVELKSSLANVSSWFGYDNGGIIATKWDTWDSATILNNISTIDNTGKVTAKAKGEAVAVAINKTNKIREYFYIKVTE